MKKHGFTLVELLAVIAILAILVIMALPAVLKMYNKARIDTFNNELNTIVRTARQQYLLGGGEPQSFNSSSNKLPLTGNSSLEYCVSIDGNGKITELKATNGNYKYESSGIVDEVHSTEVSTAESNYELSCAGGNTSSITYINRQNEGSITVGDEVAIDTEHFYVISSDSTNTVLLAKYNLLVGDVYNQNGSNWEFTKTLTTSDAGYGLQSETAKGYYDGCTERTGVVAFSGKGYWDNANCVWSGSGGSSTCSGTAGLKSEYANSANAAGKTGDYSTPYPYVYNSSMSSVAPEYGIYSNPFRAATDNEYTIAYYVEGYVNRLKSLGAPNNITGRLLTYEEAISLSSTLKGTFSHWLGSASNKNTVMLVRGGSTYGSDFWFAIRSGVRPVMVVSTSEF